MLGTNKLSASVGTAVSTWRYHNALKFSLKAFLPVIAASVIGSWLGARLALHLDPAYLRPMLLAALPVVAWLVWAHKDFGTHDHSHHLSAEQRTARGMAIALPVGAYDGFFGPGTGTFLAIAFSRWGRYDLLGATGRAKLLNLVSNTGALLTFIFAGRLDWRVGLPMMVAGTAGNWVGSHLGVKKGAAIIRPAVITVCAGLFAKILYDTL